MTGLVRPVTAVAWDLRTAWALGHRVSVTLDRCDVDRLEGIVRQVSATGAAAKIGGMQFPIDRVLAVHKPSRLGDSKVRSAMWSGAPPKILDVHPDQDQLDV